MTYTAEPQLTPTVRHRLKERFQELQDEDLPLVPTEEGELIARISARTGRSPQTIRRALHEIGAFVPHRIARHALHSSETTDEDSEGSGIPEDTTQSGTSGLGSA